MRAATGARSGPQGLLLAVYLLLLAYGSFYPFEWQLPAGELVRLPAWPRHVDRADFIQNLLVYLPLGGLLAVRWRREGERGVLLAGCAGAAISLLIEMAQYWLPARVPSMLDVVADTLGATLGGALLHALRPEAELRRQLLKLARACAVQGQVAFAGLAVLMLWFVSLNSPLVPSFDVAQLKGDLGQLLRAVAAPERMSLLKAMTHLCNLTAMGIVLLTALQRPAMAYRAYCCLLAAACALRLLVPERLLTVELLSGAFLSLPLLALCMRRPAPRLAACGAVLIAAGLVVAELAPGVGASSAFNWVPFRAQITSTDGFENLIACIWPGMALAYFLRLAVPPYQRKVCAFVGGMLLAVSMLALEWLQQQVPGRHGDVTQAAMVCVGWMAPWLVRTRKLHPSAPPVPARAPGVKPR